MRSTTFAVGVLACTLTLPAATANSQTVLNVNAWVPPSHLLVADVTMPFCKDIERRPQGRVKCNLLPKAVVAPPQTLDAVRDGLADLSFIVHGYTPGRFALTDVAEFPFLGDTSEAISVAYQRIHDKMLAKHDEHKGVHVLGVFTHGPGQIFNTKRADHLAQGPRGPEDPRRRRPGQRRRQGARHRADAQARAGKLRAAEPGRRRRRVLPQGVGARRSSSCRCIKHVTYVPGGLYNVSFALIMNPAKWKQISEADQAAINKLSGEALARRAGKAWDAADARARRRCATPTSRS